MRRFDLDRPQGFGVQKILTVAMHQRSMPTSPLMTAGRNHGFPAFWAP